MRRLPVEFSPEAQLQLLGIEEYLAERFYPESMSRFVAKLFDACAALGDNPQIGVPHDDLRPGIRSVSFERRAIIYYKVWEDRVLILAVCYGGRELVLPDE